MGGNAGPGMSDRCERQVIGNGTLQLLLSPQCRVASSRATEAGRSNTDPGPTQLLFGGNWPREGKYLAQGHLAKGGGCYGILY